MCCFITCFSRAAFPTSFVDDVSVSFKHCKLTKKRDEGLGCTSMVEYFSSMHEVLGWIPKHHKKRKTSKNSGGGLGEEHTQETLY
jgi:hypothetical protein